MKILVVCQFYYPENFVISKIAESLVEFGHDVTVLTGKPNYGYDRIIPEYRHIKFEIINGVKVHRVNLIARKKSRISIIENYLSFWKNAKHWVRRTKLDFDIIYSMSLSPVTILAPGNLYKKKHHIPHVVHCVDLWPESVCITNAVKKDSFVYNFLYKWSYNLYKNVDEVIIGSPSFKDYFHDVLKITDKKFPFIPQPSLVEETPLEPYQYDKNYLNILYCGNLGTIQLIPLIVEAMSLLKDEKIMFHIIGMGPMSDYLKEAIAKNGLERTVKYYGPIPAYQASSYFKSADAIYVSLKNEGTVGKTIPNKLVMSLNYAKPIIAVLDGDGKKILEETKGGLFAKENGESVKEAILKLKNLSLEERMAMGENNLKYYQSHLTIKNTSKQIEQELLEVLRQK